jgi:hypothetical protein
MLKHRSERPLLCRQRRPLADRADDQAQDVAAIGMQGSIRFDTGGDQQPTQFENRRVATRADISGACPVAAG